MSMRASTQDPSLSSASLSSSGESCSLAGLRAAARSTSTGTWKDRSSTSVWKVASVTSTTD